MSIQGLWEFERKYRAYIAFVLGLASALLILVSTYDQKRNATIEIGEPGDSLFLSGFYADEPDIDFRYRWTSSHSEITFVGAGSAQPTWLYLRAQGPRVENSAQPITATISLNGIALEGPFASPESSNIVTLTGELQDYYYYIPEEQASRLSPPYIATLETSTFKPSGDNRTLGIKVDRAALTQSIYVAGNRANFPPFDIIWWWLVLVAGLLGILSPLKPGYVSLVIGPGITALIFYNQSLIPGVLLPVGAVLLGVLGLLVWRWHDVKRIARQVILLRDRLADYAQPDTGDTEVPLVRSRAGLSMLAAMLLFAALALWTIPQVAWIGHADYAENANVARNLVEGRGLSVDYAAQFYQERPNVTHPAETWPLLQPLMIVPFFALFGPETWAAKLPNLFILLALAWAVFAVGSRLWDSRVGLIAGLLTLLHSYFFNAVLYPINDLGFTAIFFALVWSIWKTATDNGPQPTTDNPPSFRVSRFALVGALAGLLVWSKPSGAVLLAGLGLGALFLWWRDRKAQEGAGVAWELSWQGVMMAGGAFLVVLLPLVVRNILAFGSPYHSTEGLDAWILRYYPFYEWENIYKYYIGSELPHPRWVVGGKFGYSNLFDAIGINFQWVWVKGVMSGVTSSEFVIGVVPLLGAIAGWVVTPRRALRVVALALFSMSLYTLFVLLYWHFEGRYFQVAIPWLYLLIAGAVVWLSDLAARTIKGAAGSVVSSVLMAAMTVGLLWPHVWAISDLLRFDTRPTSFTVAMDWLKENSTPDDVVMTRDPWELNWYTERRAVMIPYDGLDKITQVARDYGVTMLQLGGPTDGFNVAVCPEDGSAPVFPANERPARPVLGKLYCGEELPGFSLVYQNGDLTIYRWQP